MLDTCRKIYIGNNALQMLLFVCTEIRKKNASLELSEQ